MMLLRSMQQARYSEHNHGHYGLAAEYYTHFTSPIRRYPDLMVHRMVREYGKSQEVADHFEQVLPDIANQSSSRGAGLLMRARNRGYEEGRIHGKTMLGKSTMPWFPVW